MLPLPPRSTLFPYTTLFRSHEARNGFLDFEALLLWEGRLLGGNSCCGHQKREEQPKECIVERIRPAELYVGQDRKSTRLNSSHITISYAVFCLKKKKQKYTY